MTMQSVRFHRARRSTLALVIAGMLFPAVALSPAPALAEYPDRPIRLVVPFPPGGVVDIIGRLWASKVDPLLGTIVVENIGGAGGTIATGEVARKSPDGYTLLLGNTSTQILRPAAMAKPPYDPEKAFTTIAIVAESAISIAINPSVPAKTLPELIAYFKANPAKASYASPGAGTLTNLFGETLKKKAGIPKLVHIPYKGTGPAMSDLISGHIPMLLVNVTNQVLALEKSGKIRIVAVASPKRLTVLPNVPTVGETYKGMTGVLFTGLFAPAGTPKAIIDKIAAASQKAMKDPDLQKKLVDAGLEPVVDTPAEAQRYVDEERKNMLPEIKAAGFKL